MKMISNILLALVCCVVTVYSAVDHRLTEGTVFSVNINAASVLRPVNRNVMGISAPMLYRLYDQTTGNWSLNTERTTALTNLNIPFSRFYYRDNDSREPWTTNVKIDKTADYAARLGISQAGLMIEIEPPVPATPTPTPFTPTQFANAVTYSKSKGYKFNIWEVGNEPNMIGYYTPATYATHLKDVATAIKAVQADAKIGLSWMDSTSLHDAAGSYDFVIPHYYLFSGSGLGSRFMANIHTEDAALYGNYNIFKTIQADKDLIKTYNPTKTVEILDSEWGCSARQSDGSDPAECNRNGNIFGALHRAVRLIYYVREAVVEAASQWECIVNRSDSSTVAFGFIPKLAGSGSTDETKLYLNYYLNYYFARYTGTDVLAINGTCPFFTYGGISGPKAPVLATKSADGKTLYIIAANGVESENLSCNINLQGFTAVTAAAKKLTQSGLDSPSLVNSESDVISDLTVNITGGGASIQFTASARSISFIALSGDAAATGGNTTSTSADGAPTLRLINNRFNPEKGEIMNIECGLKQAGNLKIDIYNLKNELMASIVNENKSAGGYTFTWAGKNLNGEIVASGLYFVVMEAGFSRVSKKSVVIK